MWIRKERSPCGRTEGSACARTRILCSGRHNMPPKGMSSLNRAHLAERYGVLPAEYSRRSTIRPNSTGPRHF